MNPVAVNSAISKIGQIQEARQTAAKTSSVSAAEPSGALGFAELINNYVQQTNVAQRASDSAIESFATGKSENVQQVVLAMANAEVSFQMFMEIRNKLIDSYNELMRMQF